MIGLFIFTRDLRLEDNTALNLARKECKSVIPVFIFSPILIDKNRYFGDYCFNFLIESLEDLNKKLRMKGSKLYCFYGKHENVVNKLIKKLDINSVYINDDVTPFSKERRDKINKVCKNNDAGFKCIRDLFLLEQPLEKRAYMFTPYYEKVMKGKIQKPITSTKNNFYHKSISGEVDVKKIAREYSDRFAINTKRTVLFGIGGRKEALKKIIKITKDYESNTYNQTSGLSSYLKYGCISSREVFWFIRKKFGKRLDKTFLRQLIWRDFYYQMFDNNPDIFFTDKPKVKWRNDKTEFKKWCEGKTGYPIIDAAMRELKETGCMHNRIRLVVSCFLVKILYIDWRWGELWFAKYLLDYDPVLNNANWQWVSGTLPGSRQPWFRIISPKIQSKKFDPDCEYIKLWVPELKDVPSKDIHKWEERYNNYKGIYREPIVDFDKRKKKYVG